MNRARLIKQGTASERKSIAASAPPKPAAKPTVKMVREWLTERRAPPQTKARQAFDALFT
ncbi:MAG: hypothetical protein ACREAM_19525 [Blastocatellia bacterium]